jgi:hypothetical protein
VSPDAAVIATARATTLASSSSAPRISGRTTLAAKYDPLTDLPVGRIADDRVVDGVTLGPTPYFAALGNNAGVNDCSVVAVMSVTTIDAIRSGRALRFPTTASAVTAWQTLNGGSTSGVSDEVLLRAWSSPQGVLHSRIRGWATLNVLSIPTLKAAIRQTGGVYASLMVPEDTSWSTVVWSSEASSLVASSAHAVALIGWTARGLIAVSWGEVVLIPWTSWKTEAISAFATTLR